MPIWMQGITVGVMLAWLGVITKMVLKHGEVIATINQRCEDRVGWIKDIDSDRQKNTDAIASIVKTINRTDRNVIRLALERGIENPLEQEGD